MVRFLFSRTDNHRIARDGLTGRAAAKLRRAWDPVAAVADGKNHGLAIESTIFTFNATWGAFAGDPGPTNPDWIHPISGLPMAVHPRFFIIEVPTMLMGSNAVVSLLEQGDIDSNGDLVRDRFKRHLQKNNFTAAELNELRATHRQRFSPTKFGTLVTARP